MFRHNQNSTTGLSARAKKTDRVHYGEKQDQYCKDWKNFRFGNYFEIEIDLSFKDKAHGGHSSGSDPDLSFQINND